MTIRIEQRGSGGYQGLVASIWYLVRLVDVDGVVVGEEFDVGAVVAGGVDALDDADSGS